MCIYIYWDMNAPRNLVDIDILDILGKYYWENMATYMGFVWGLYNILVYIIYWTVYELDILGKCYWNN